MATKLQRRANEIMMANPGIKPKDALLSAGYSEKSVVGGVPRLIDSKGLVGLRDVYQYELIKKGITGKFLARIMKKGLKDQDKKTVLAYAIEAKKDLEIANESVDTAIQINLGSEINELAE